MPPDLLQRKQTHFVLWIPRTGVAPPTLVIGELQYGAPPSLAGEARHALQPAPGAADLWHIPASSCGLAAGKVYRYWYEVDETDPGGQPGSRIPICDPTAVATDWRLTKGDQPAAIVKFENGNLVACDGGGEAVQSAVPVPGPLATNNQLVIYELPTAWTRAPRGGGIERGVGTFRDVLALVDRNAAAANFSDVGATAPGQQYLVDLGVNAVELLPPADSFYEREWGYGTSHFFAPDFDLGFPDGFSWPTANADLRRLADALHARGMRLIVDAVLGFARSGPYQHAAFDQFHIAFDPDNPPKNDPDAWSSRPGQARGQWGATLFRYVRKVSTYDPVSGAVAAYPPARRLMLTALARWMQDFQVDGFRLDSLETVANWDFIGEFSQAARDQFRNARNLGAGADARFLVVGEELEHPIGLIAQKRVDGLWNDNFRNYIRPALLGSNAREEPSFEWTVRKAIDARLHGFGDCAQAVNYLGSHDVEGVAKERLCTFFRYAGLDDGEILRRTKLAFACLLTSVGIPMILAGDEFGDEHDSFDRLGHVTHEGGKQVDPVNFSRLEGPGNQWRRDLLKYVSNLIASRTSCPGLGRNEIDFIHVDFAPGRRVMAWKRGTDADPVVVVANFSDFESGADPEYRVTGWPTVSGRQWYEVTQGRNVPAVWVGREPVFRWEAKVYALRP